jgi:arabinan endo-1,5-alpha-L-arabinosidase
VKYLSLLLLLFILQVQIQAQAPSLIPVHDPVIIQQDSTWYIFCTGQGISVWSSTDRLSWKKESPVFSTPPVWALNSIPGFKGHIWAPDISYYNGVYYLYYAVSAFGKNTSAIGLATNKTLNPASPYYKWQDHGQVIQSVPGRDMWNAIDPNLIIDSAGTPWLSFGSFWNGIKLVRLNPEGTAPAGPQEWYTIAARPRDPATPDSSAGNAAIEAPFIFKKNGYYYLFVSWDYCCRAEKSTYKVVVGRSKKLAGPYYDKAGTDMRLNGGTLLLEGDKDWYGAGHNAVYSSDGKEFIVFHAYDAHDKGRSKLRIKLLYWDRDAWPVIGKE